MKSWKIVMVSGVAAAMLLSGCGEKKSDNAPETAVKTEKAAPAPAPAVETPAKPEAKAPAAPAPEAKAPAPAEAEAPAAEAVKEAAAPVKEEAAKQAEAVQQSVETEAKKATESAEAAAAAAKKSVDAAVLFTKCAGCHGMKGEKHALGQSNVIAGQSKEELVKKIEGYQKGTYGGAMKGLMAGQVKNLTPEEVDALADYISKL
jgi:cytochrome c553